MGGRIGYLFLTDNRSLPLLSAKMGLCKTMTACKPYKYKSTSPLVWHQLEYPVSKQELPLSPGLAWGCCINDFLRHVPLKAASSQVHSCARRLCTEQITGFLLAPGCDSACQLGHQTDVSLDEAAICCHGV